MKFFFQWLLIGLVGWAQLASAAFVETDAFNGLFSESTGWNTYGKGVELTPGEEKSLRLRYELDSAQQFVTMAKEVKQILPENYKFEFLVKNPGPSNTLEFKLIDGKGNTHLRKWENLYSTNTWKKMTVMKKDIKFGWGPVANSALTDVAKIEIAVSYGAAGKGEMCFKELHLVPMPVMAVMQPVKIKVSSEQEQDSGRLIMDGNMSSRWSSQFGDDEWIEFDFGAPKQLVGLMLYWEAAFGKEYEIQLSNDGKQWKKVYATLEGKGGVEDIDFEAQSARYLKLHGTKRGTGWGYSLWEVVLKTAEEPFGVGVDAPEFIVKDSWDFKQAPSRTIYIPASWNSNSTVLWLDGDFAEAELKLNGQTVSRIKPEMKRPVKVELKNSVRVGQANKISLQLIAGKGDSLVHTLLLLKSAASLNEVKQNLQLSSPMDYYKFMSRIYPAGTFPVWLNNKQEYWTVVGQDSGYSESLFSTAGIISVAAKSYSLTPFLYTNDRLVTAADVKREVSLEKGYLPIPRVRWTYSGIEFDQTLFSGQVKKGDANYLWYHIRNTTQTPWAGKLFLAFRPFEVNPPWQYGGLTKIASLRMPDQQHVVVNEENGLVALTPCSDFGGMSYEQGDVIEKMYDGQLPADQSVKDPSGFISGAMAYDLQLAPNAELDLMFVIPLDSSVEELPVITKPEFFQALDKSKKYWEQRVENFDIQIPEQRLIDVMRANIAYMLINKDGPAIQPGSRCYKNSWVRDGAVMAAALLRTGHSAEVRDFITWVAKTVKDTGEVPFLLNAHSMEMPEFAKQWKEWDSQGEFVFILAEYYRFSKDKKIAEQVFPMVVKALGFLKELRSQMSQPQHEGTPMYGILPKSESHEGYIGNPQQSTWDDFWALKGWKDGWQLATALGKKHLIPGMKAEEVALRKNLLQNMQTVQEQKKLAYLPASIGLGDCDPTSTSISVFPTGEYKFMDHKEILKTLDKYYQDTFAPRLTKGLQSSYTPYEIRTANAYNFLGEKDKALTMLRYFLKDARPQEWNHWAEVVHADPLAGAYVGDMPHSWIGGIYINTVRNLFLYEDEDAVILGSGIDAKWLQQGVTVKNMPTYFGIVNYSMSEKNGIVQAEVTGDAHPGKGFVLCSPYENRKIKQVRINGKTVQTASRSKVEFDRLPAKLELEFE